MALTIISLCLFTSMPSFMLWRTVILFRHKHVKRLPAQLTSNTSVAMQTYGISSGNTSARMLMESVFALDVGAAASKSFKRAI